MNDYKELIVHIAMVMALEDECGQKELADMLEKAADAIEQLIKERNVLEFQNHLERCEHEHTKKERDAAVADLKRLDINENGGGCCYSMFCSDEDCANFEGDGSDCWKWRGLQEEMNNGSD